MQDKIRAQDKIMTQIERAFSAHREQNTSKRIRYPEKLKELIRSGAALGISSRGLAQASGVSFTSLAEWIQQSEMKEQPRELRIVEHERRVDSDSQPNDLAHIHLLSGVRIDLPTRALSADVLWMLGATGAMRAGGAQ